MASKGDPISGLTFGASSTYKGPIPEDLEVKTLRVTSGLDVGNLNVTGTFSYNNINASAEVQTDTLTEFTAGADISVLNSLIFTRPDAPLALSVFDLAGGTNYGLAKIGGTPSYQSKYVPFSSSVASGYTFTGSNGSGIETMLARLEYDSIVSRSVLAISKIVGLGSNGTYIDAPVIGNNAPVLPGGLRYNNAGNVLQYCDNAGVFKTLSVGEGVAAGAGINVAGIVVSLADSIAPSTITSTNISTTNLGVRNINNVTGQNIKFTSSGSNNVNINDMIICDANTTLLNGEIMLNTVAVSSELDETYFHSNTGKINFTASNGSGGLQFNLVSSMDGIGINKLTTTSGSGNISIANSIDLALGKLINGIDLSAFYSSYTSRIDQAVNTTSNVTFGNVTSNGAINGSSISVSGSSTALNTYTSGLYANTLKANMAVDTGITIAGVDLASFYTAYGNNINQAVKTTSSPQFSGLQVINLTTMNDLKVNFLGANEAAINVESNIIMDPGLTIDGVDLSAFYSDYTGKVGQAVLTTSSPTFANVTSGGTISAATISGTTVKGNTISSITGNITLSNNIVPSAGVTFAGVDIATFNSDYVAKVNQAVKSTSSPSFAGLTLSGPVTTNSTIDGITLSTTISGANPLLTTSSPTFAGMTLTGNATEQLLLRTSTGTGKAKLVLGTPTVGTAPNKAALIAVGSGTNSTNTVHLCLNNSTNNTSAAEVSETDARITVTSGGLVGINYVGGTPTDNLSVLSTTDNSRFNMTFNYGTGTRACYTRMNSGTTSAGRNRVEFYGIDSQYNSGSSSYDAFNSTFGFTFQQKPTFSGSYYDILDITSSGVNIGSSSLGVPLKVSGAITQNVGQAMVFTNPGSIGDYYFGRSSASTGIEISAVTGGTNYIKPSANTESIEIQSWSGSSPSTVMRFSNDMVSVNRLVLNNNVAGVLGGIGRNGTSLQFNDGVAVRDVCVRTMDTTTAASYIYGPTYTVLGATTLTTTATHTYVVGGSFTGITPGSDVLSFSGRWTFIGVTFTTDISLTSASVPYIEFVGCKFIFNNNQRVSLGSIGDIIVSNCLFYGTNYAITTGTLAPVIIGAPHMKFVNNKISWNTFNHSAITDILAIVRFVPNLSFGSTLISGNSIKFGPTGPSGSNTTYGIYVDMSGSSAGTAVHYTNNHFEIMTDNMQASKTFACLYINGGILDVSNNTFACNNSSSTSTIYPVIFANRNKLFGRTNTKIGAMDASYRDNSFTIINFDTEGNSLLS